MNQMSPEHFVALYITIIVAFMGIGTIAIGILHKIESRPKRNPIKR